MSMTKNQLKLLLILLGIIAALFSSYPRRLKEAEEYV